MEVMNMTSRGYTEIMRELRQIKDNATNHKIEVMADALAWGYGSARTNWVLETRLYKSPDLLLIVTEIAAGWDGQNYLEGALHTAQRFYSEALPDLVKPRQIPNSWLKNC